MSAKDRLIRVEPGTRPSKCSGKALGGSCDARIYWVREWDQRYRKHRAIPVSCAGRGLQEPSEATDVTQSDLFSGTPDVHEGFGVDHAATCPDRALIARMAAIRHEEQRHRHA